jgi:nicotinamidase-related amidase
MTKALLVIDVQNDYFEGGRFPLWNTEATLAATEQAITRAREHRVPVLYIQHISAATPSPLFERDTAGVELHPRIAATVGDAPVIVKQFADSFHQTTLAAELDKLGATELVICGMMTQNCVTHTAISKAAERYAVTVIPDACTTVDAMIHRFAVGAIATRIKLASVAEAL